MKTTFRPRTHRIVQLIWLTHPTITQHRDEGNAKDGSETTSRGQLRDTLAKTIKVNGKLLPAAMLYEPPEMMFGAESKFDREHLRDKATGDWLVPTAEWHAEREKRIAKLDERKARSKRAAQNKAARRAMKGLAKLVGEGADELEREVIATGSSQQRKPPTLEEVMAAGYEKRAAVAIVTRERALAKGKTAIEAETAVEAALVKFDKENA